MLKINQVYNYVIYKHTMPNGKYYIGVTKNKRPRGKAYKQTKDTLSDFSGGEFKTSEYHNEDLRYPQNIINIKSTEKECNQIHIIHPTQKPIALFEYLIKTYTNENDLVLDNCMGSFTTAVACENLNRNYIGFENDDKYYELGMKRLEELRVSRLM